MDHDEAMQRRAAERYLLGDLSVPDVEEFERHFFDCPQCSEELRTLAVLRENARAVFLEQSTRPIPVPAPVVAAQRNAGRVNWWNFRILAPAAAMLAIAGFFGFEAGERRFGWAPQPVSEFPLYAAARGGETVVTLRPGARFYALYMDRTWDRDFASYQASFTDSTGRVRFTVPLGAPAPGQAFHVLIPVESMSAGNYTLAVAGVEGGGETEVARYPFALRFE